MPAFPGSNSFLPLVEMTYLYTFRGYIELLIRSLLTQPGLGPLAALEGQEGKSLLGARTGQVPLCGLWIPTPFPSPSSGQDAMDHYILCPARWVALREDKGAGQWGFPWTHL